MNIEEVREYCISHVAVTESFPFDEETLVFKVMNKMFALMPLERGNTISLKCDPEYALELRDRYPEEIQAAWHMNKTHWNSVILNGTVGRKLIEELITHSYDLVVSKLKKADKATLQAMKEQEEK
ncbi:MAG: MmcQ/YjbR family DNA-binding protein [Bacteroidota bacterium]